MNSNVKFLYVIDYWDGDGLINLIAENDTEALELLSNEELFLEDYGHLIMEKIITATKLELANDYESGIIQAFCT
mgnify:CR=1 FL=1|jgi:hypothetical protein